MSWITINWERALKVLKGAGLAAAGCAVVFLIDNFGQLELGGAVGGAIAALTSTALNYLRKLIEELKEKKPAV